MTQGTEDQQDNPSAASQGPPNQQDQQQNNQQQVNGAQHSNQQHQQQHHHQQHAHNSLQPVGHGGGRGGGRGPRIVFPTPVADVGDGRIVLLFDLNGVLTEKTPPRLEGKWLKRDHIVRPHIEELLRLYPHFRIGVFSSATVRTVNTALDTLYAALQRSTAQRGIDGLLLPKKYDLFNVIYYRDHCQPDPYVRSKHMAVFKKLKWRSREDGQEHDTIKPLARLGFDLNRTVLVDNDDYKAADGEHENMLHVPHWEQTEETNRDFPLMIQLILRHLKGIEGDVRPHLRLIERQLRQLRSTDASRLQTAADRARTRAVTAATAQEWAGDDSIREALAAEEVPRLDGVSAAWLPEEVQLTPQMQQKLRQCALQGFKANSAADLAAAPPAATQLIELLSKHKADPAAPAAAVDVQQLLADATEEVKEGHTQHSLVLLLAAAWGCNITAPAGTFTLGQIADLFKSRGWPTDHLTAAVEAMIKGGTVKVHGQEPQQQQQQQWHQQQQQRWAWPEPPDYWPSPAVQLPAAAGGEVQPPPPRQQQQQSPAWTNCLLLLPELRVNKLMKSVSDVTSFLATAVPAAVADVVQTLEYNCRMATAPEGQRDELQQQRQQQLAGKSPDERQRLTSLAYAWSTVIHAAVRDVAAMHGVTAQQLLWFIKGLSPTLQQQLLGPSSSSEQQQLQRLQELLQQLEVAVKAVPVRIKNKRQKALLCAPFAVFAANPLGIFRQQTGGNAAEGVHSDPAAAAALTTYAVGVVPNAEAVARSIRVLEAAAGAADVAAVAAAVEAARVEQQQQLDRHVAQQGGPAQHSALQQLKPPVTACLTLSPHLSLPAVVVQWLMQCEQARQQQEQQTAAAAAAAGEGRQDGKRQREGADAAAAGGGLSSRAPRAAAAAAADGGSASKKQKRDARQHEDGAVAAAAAAAAAGGSSRSSSQEDAAAEAADHEADLDALYDREEQQRQQYEAEMAALEAEEEAVAAAELAAIDTAGEAWFEPKTSSAAAAAAAEGSDIELLLPDADEECEEDLGAGEDEEGLGDEGDQGSDIESDDDDPGFDGAAGAAEAGGSGSEGGEGQGGSEGGYSEEGDGGADEMGAGSGSDGPESQQDGPDSDGPGEDDGLDWGEDGEEEYLLDTEDREGESRGEFEGELGSEDDSWATDDEADGQLQLGITGLEESAMEADTAAAAAAEDAAVDAAAAETAAAMQHASAAAAAAGRQVRGRLPLYGKLQAALSAARGGGGAAIAGPAGGSSGSNPQQQQQQPSQLHFELLQFAAAAAPCTVEQLFVQKALQQLQGAADITWPNNEPEALLFGSQATGLALPGSDLDVVLLRVPGCPTPSKTDKGFGLKDKQRVASLLGSFAKCLRSEGYASKKGLQVVIARVPILKGTLSVHMPQSELLAALASDSPTAAEQLAAAAAAAACGAGQNGKRERVLTVEMQVDISIGIADSSAAVNYIQRQVRTLAPMRPLLLTAKAVLREAGLNEVFTGGLGSYALALLVISHLQAEGVADLATSAMLPSDLTKISHQSMISEHLQQLSAAAATLAVAGSSGGGRQQQQQQQWDLGLLLQGFFLRYGALFDYKVEAVVVNQGGVLTKPRQWVQDKRPFLLSVEDPAMPGRDMSSGSYAIREVKSAFTRAAGILRELTTKFEGADTSQNRNPAAAAAAQGGVTLQERVAAAVAAAVLAAPGSIVQPPQQQQQQQAVSPAFAVVEDRDAWAAVQADGASQSFGNNVTNNVTSAAARDGGGSSKSSPVASGLAAVASSREQQLIQGLNQGLGMMGQLMDVVAALARGAGADAHRSEQARRAALRGQARLTAQKLQYGQQLGTISAVQQQQQQQQQQQVPAQLNGKARRKLARAEKQQQKRRAQRKPVKPLKVKLTKKQHQQQQIKQKRQANIMSLYACQQQQQGGQQQQQQQQKGGGRRRPLTRGQLRVQEQKWKANQQQQQQGQQQRRVPAKRQRMQQQQQQGRKRARDGGASGGGGGRGWGYE